MICRCDPSLGGCGAQDVEVLLELLVKGTTRSCGCLRRETSAANNAVVKRVHGMRHHELYATWTSEKARCSNPANPGYKDYGGRGIKFYPPWQDFPTFVCDVEAEIGPRPPGKHPRSGRALYTLDRKDNDGDYWPGNIRWADAREQLLNRRAVHGLAARVIELEDENRRLTAEVGALTAELEVERRTYR